MEWVCGTLVCRWRRDMCGVGCLKYLCYPLNWFALIFIFISFCPFSLHKNINPKPYKKIQPSLTFLLFLTLFFLVAKIFSQNFSQSHNPSIFFFFFINIACFYFYTLSHHDSFPHFCRIAQCFAVVTPIEWKHYFGKPRFQCDCKWYVYDLILIWYTLF